MKKLVIALLALLATTVWASAATLGDDGLHKEPCKRLMVIIEQRGCIYCKKMHEEVFSVEEVGNYITDNFFVVQINMFGDVEVTDFDGEALPEKDMVKKWGALFTPMILFMPQEVAEDASAARVAVATMPGAFGRHTTFNMLNWVVEKGDEPFQKYHARKFGEGNE